MNLIKLDESLYLGKGRERKCYVHPHDFQKVIKVVYRKDQGLNQNEMEYSYIQYLKKNKREFSNITNCYGFVNTNIGKGFVFDRVLDFDNTQSKSFKELVLNSFFSKDEELKLIEDLKQYIFKNNIIFVDIALSNILCKKIDKNTYKLILTDGIGGKRYGLKSKLYQYSKVFTKYKVIKQWKKFLKRYEKVSSMKKLNK